MRLERRCTIIIDSEFRIQDGRIPIEESGYDNPVLKMVPSPYSPVSIKNTVLRPNWQYKASTAEMAENRYS